MSRNITYKRIVCLANSRKLSGRCIAGKELVEGEIAGWFRPVSSRKGGEVSEQERRYHDGRDPKVLDILDVPVLAAEPKSYQQENWRLDSRHYWKRIGKWPANDLSDLLDPPGQLWIDDYSSFSGLNDRVPLSQSSEIKDSLRFLIVEKLTLKVFAPGLEFGNPKRRVQALFKHGREIYSMFVTDPVIEREYLARTDGQYPVGPSFLTVSLGEPFQDYIYKLVAAVIPKRAEG